MKLPQQHGKNPLKRYWIHEETTTLMLNNRICNTEKLKSIIHKFHVSRACGIDEIFCEHIAYAEPSVCLYPISLFHV